MIADLALRWVVTVFFVLSAAECAYAFTRARDRPGSAVSQLLHLAMAVAMLAMAWPRGAELPTAGPTVFFLAAAVWFLAGALRPDRAGGRLVNGYHAAMMTAMAWMYALMNGTFLTQHPEAVVMAGHHMHAMEHGAPQPVWIPVVNGVLTIGFVVAAAAWLYRYFVARRQSPVPSAHFGTLCRAMMAAGMAIMFGVMV
ncbi:DUF5134 domain-containing protein [Mycolicibacterium sp. HK-90]|uniref:DUF5134 domain-containing protein n=1 Tax=Mycolicibacterium sp. HK-90 TaxID=3056937 RepID=UPI002658D01E|nr:DUF5134 domain-containing protein [Mycolicibacterium sp. HK-90]WKG01701.1 DUF5134 domain-containing protein [Mycolicibacterium sp. HK-90]